MSVQPEPNCCVETAQIGGSLAPQVGEPCTCNVYASDGSGRVIAWRSWSCPQHKPKENR